MRRILLLTTFLLANVAIKAQDLEFKYKGESLIDGATVTITAEENFLGEMSCETNPAAAPQDGLVLKCPVAFGGVVTADLQIMSNTLNASVIQWCMGGECTPVRKELLTKTFSPGPDVQVSFDATNITGNGSLLAKLTVRFNSHNRTVYIQFLNGEDETSVHHLPVRVHTEAIYDLGGRRVGVPFNRLYIKNGKKYLLR